MSENSNNADPTQVDDTLVDDTLAQSKVEAPQPLKRGPSLFRRAVRALLLGTALATLVVWAAVRTANRQLPAVTGLDRADVMLGAYHVHSQASHDSEQSLESIAESARKLGLDFVLVTDHNSQLAGPVWLNGVLLLSFAELSTPFGHVVQLGAHDVLSKDKRGDLDIHQHIRGLGGAPILAHPNDPKRPWNGPVADAAGLEIANLSSAVRRHGGPVFLRLVLDLPFYVLNPRLMLAQLYERDHAALARWDENPQPDFVGLCANDAHGWINLTKNLQTWLLVLHQPWPQERLHQPAAVLDALQGGRFHCSAGLFGSAVPLQFGARAGFGWTAAPGESVSTQNLDELVALGPTVIDTDAQNLRMVLLRNGEAVLHTQGATLRYPQPAEGTYRVELHLDVPAPWGGRRMVPVAYSNRLRVLSPPLVPPAPSSFHTLQDDASSL